jgi:hypothetical protein
MRLAAVLERRIVKRTPGPVLTHKPADVSFVAGKTG